MDQLLASIAPFIEHLITVGYNVSYTIHPVNYMDVSRGKMILWTIQDMAAWKHLQQKGVLMADGRRIYGYHRYAYKWMAEQMRLRLSHPHYRFPLWGWYQWERKERPKPDLRSSGHLPKGATGVRIEFAIPENRVLLSDFDAWHFVLNRWFLCLCEKEDKDFTEELARAGIPQRWSYPEPFRSRIINSWQRIFDLETGDPEWWGSLSERSLQATFWELKLSQVSHVDTFTAR